MEDKDVKRWYQKHGMEYIPEDWGPRLDTGESAPGTSSWSALRVGREWVWRMFVNPTTLDEMRVHLVGGRPRTPEEQRVAEAMDEFFAPYIAMLPRAKGEVLRELINDRKTYEDIANSGRFYDRGHAHRAVKRAVRALMYLIAKDDPDFTGGRDETRERESARRVFDHYMERRLHG